MRYEEGNGSEAQACGNACLSDHRESDFLKLSAHEFKRGFDSGSHQQLIVCLQDTLERMIEDLNDSPVQNRHLSIAITELETGLMRLNQYLLELQSGKQRV